MITPEALQAVVYAAQERYAINWRGLAADVLAAAFAVTLAAVLAVSVYLSLKGA